MATEPNETAAAPKAAKGAAPAGNRIKQEVAGRFQAYKTRRDEVIAANEGDVLQKRYDVAADFNSYVEGFSACGALLGGFNADETKVVSAVKTAVDLDISRIESEAELAEILG